MKDLTKSKLKVFSLSVFVITLLTAALRTICLFAFYEPNVGYFRAGVASVIVTALYVLGLALCVCPLFLLPREQITVDGAFRKNLSFALCCPAVIAFFVCGIVILGNGAIRAIKFDVLTGIFCIISALFFLSSALSQLPPFKGRFDASRPWLCIAVIAALLLMLSSAYFDMTVNINGPFTTVFLFSLLSCALFLLSEIRHDIGRPLALAHFVSGLAAFFLSASSAIGNLLFCLFGDTGAGKTLSDPTRPILLLCVSLFVLARLLSFTAPKQEN